MQQGILYGTSLCYILVWGIFWIWCFGSIDVLQVQQQESVSLFLHNPLSFEFDGWRNALVKKEVMDGGQHNGSSQALLNRGADSCHSALQ